MGGDRGFSLRVFVLGGKCPGDTCPGVFVPVVSILEPCLCVSTSGVDTEASISLVIDIFGYHRYLWLSSISLVMSKNLPSMV